MRFHVRLKILLQSVDLILYLDITGFLISKRKNRSPCVCGSRFSACLTRFYFNIQTILSPSLHDMCKRRNINFRLFQKRQRKGGAKASIFPFLQLPSPPLRGETHITHNIPHLLFSDIHIHAHPYLYGLHIREHGELILAIRHKHEFCLGKMAPDVGERVLQ